MTRMVGIRLDTAGNINFAMALRFGWRGNNRKAQHNFVELMAALREARDAEIATLVPVSEDEISVAVFRPKLPSSGNISATVQVWLTDPSLPVAEAFIITPLQTSAERQDIAEAAVAVAMLPTCAKQRVITHKAKKILRALEPEDYVGVQVFSYGFDVLPYNTHLSTHDINQATWLMTECVEAWAGLDLDG